MGIRDGGGTVFIRPSKFIVISNYSIDDCFIDDDVELAAIKRRFVIIHFPNKYTI